MNDTYILSPFFTIKKYQEKINLVDIISGKKFMITDPYISNFLIESRNKELSITDLHESINTDNADFLINKKILIEKSGMKESAYKTVEYNHTLFNLLDYKKEAKIVFMGVPFGGGNYTSDETKTFPNALRNISKKNNINFKGSNFNAIGITKEDDIEKLNLLFRNNELSDGGDIFIHKHETIPDIYDKITFFSKKIIKEQQLPFFIGGDHSVTYSILKGINEQLSTPFSVLHFDAHTDVYTSEYDAILRLNEGYHHGNFVKKALQLQNLERYHQYGIRGLSNLRTAKNEKLEITYASHIKNNLENIKKLDPTKKYYITFDIDVLDPSIAPGTATPEPNGLLLQELYNLFDYLLKGINIIGFDLVEVNPKKDVGEITQSLAIQLLIKLLTYVKTTNDES